VRVVDVRGVQSHLSAELAEPIEQAVGAPLRGGWSHPQDLEVGMIQSFSLFIIFCLNLFVTLDSMLQRNSTVLKPHYLGIWLPTHDDDEATTEKVVSNNIKCHAQFVTYPYLLNILQE
jgi:hypothetical protein